MLGLPRVTIVNCSGAPASRPETGLLIPSGYNSYSGGHDPRKAFRAIRSWTIGCAEQLDVSLCTGECELLSIIRRNQQRNDWDVLRLASRVAFQFLSSCDDVHVFHHGAGLALVSPDWGSGDHHLHPRSWHNICEAAHWHRDRTHTRRNRDSGGLHSGATEKAAERHGYGRTEQESRRTHNCSCPHGRRHVPEACLWRVVLSITIRPKCPRRVDCFRKIPATLYPIGSECNRLFSTPIYILCANFHAKTQC